MLKERLIPTPLIHPDEVKPIRIVPIKPVRRGSSLLLIFRLIWFGFAFTSLRLRRAPSQEIAEYTRHFLEGLGGLWVKAGQLISLRIDLLSKEMTDELTQLTFRAFGFDPAISRQVIEESLGVPIEKVFDVFEEHPFAAASISQIHKARLRHNGQWVVVKVQRPGIEKMLERDLGLIKWLLRRAHLVPTLGHIKWDGMIRELEEVMKEEVDFRYEVANLRRLRKTLKKHKVYVPKHYQKYSKVRVAVMEFIPGVLMSDYLRINRTDPQRIKQWDRENNVKQVKLGSRMLRSFYRQLYEDNLFHGDLHPGNIILLKNSRFALIDMGTIGSLEQNFIKVYRSLAIAYARRDYVKAADIYLLMADSIPPIDLAGYRAATVELARSWEARSHMKDLTFLEKSITGGLANDLSTLARKYKVNPSWQSLRVARSLGTMDANLSVLLADQDPMKILRKYFKQAQRRQWDEFRKTAFRRFMESTENALESIGYVSTTLRRQAIQFDGIQTRWAYVSSVFFRFVRVGIFIIAAILIYDLLRDFHFDVIQNVYHPTGILAQLSDQLPNYTYEIGLLMIVVAIILFFVVGRIRKRLSRPSVRLPDGNLEHI